VLGLLQQLGVKATFYVIGERLQRHPAFATSAFADGHEVGNHLWRDVRAFGLVASEFDDQLTRTETLIRETLGRDLPSAHGKPLRWFRPGGGWFHGDMLRQALSRGYPTLLGSIWPLDTYGPPAWFQRLFILTTAHPGGIVVLHDPRPGTQPAAPPGAASPGGEGDGPKSRRARRQRAPGAGNPPSPPGSPSLPEPPSTAPTSPPLRDPAATAVAGEPAVPPD
jgi:peptidoglycan/xylan/chitin deacetylase (PgdA/CDA1 family)